MALSLNSIKELGTAASIISSTINPTRNNISTHLRGTSGYVSEFDADAPYHLTRQASLIGWLNQRFLEASAIRSINRTLTGININTAIGQTRRPPRISLCHQHRAAGSNDLGVLRHQRKSGDQEPWLSPTSTLAIGSNSNQGKSSAGSTNKIGLAGRGRNSNDYGNYLAAGWPWPSLTLATARASIIAMRNYETFYALSLSKDLPDV